MLISMRLGAVQAHGRERSFFGGSSFGTEDVRAVRVSIWISIVSACLRWSVVAPHALPTRVKLGKGRQIVAKGCEFRPTGQDHRTAGISRAMRYDFCSAERGRGRVAHQSSVSRKPDVGV